MIIYIISVVLGRSRRLAAGIRITVMGCMLWLLGTPLPLRAEATVASPTNHVLDLDGLGSSLEVPRYFQWVSSTVG